MHVAPRPGGIGALRKIVLHVNVGPEIEGGAQSLANYLRTIEGGYHEIVDDRTVVRCANADQVVYGASGMNDAGYHICLVGNVQSADAWHDPYSSAQLRIAAALVAARCRDFALPARLLTDTQIADVNAKGVCDHWGVNRAIVQPAVARGDRSMGPGDHVDVGPGFPWVEFMGQVAAVFPAGPPLSIRRGDADYATMVKVGHINLLGHYSGRQVTGGAPVYGFSTLRRVYAQGTLAKARGHDLFVRAVDRSHIA